MDSIEKFLRNVSYKFPKGYPDINDPKDKERLFEMIKEITGEKSLLTEGDKLYDDVILHALYGTDIEGKEIPTSKHKYKF